MTSTNIRARRLVAAGAFAVVAVAAPFAASVLGSTDASDDLAGPPCLAWVGNIEDNNCVSYSNGNGVNLGTPEIGIYGPDSGSLPGGGVGVSTGPLLPGQTWTTPVG